MNDDKIYARIVCDEFGCEVRASLKNNGGKEYIRKEALMKWLKERNCSTLSSAGYSTGHSVWAEVIDKLNSM